jgi:type IV pilus assembly protein PilC
MLATLLQGGLPLVPAMETAGSSMSSRRILKGVMRAGTRVREGQGLAPSLEEQEIFPGLAVEMIEVGESTGALPQMLNSVAEFYEEDVQTALGATMALIEPIILDRDGNFRGRRVDFAVYADLHIGSALMN